MKWLFKIPLKMFDVYKCCSFESISFESLCEILELQFVLGCLVYYTHRRRIDLEDKATICYKKNEAKQVARQGICPPIRCDDRCLVFLINPSSMIIPCAYVHRYTIL